MLKTERLAIEAKHHAAHMAELKKLGYTRDTIRPLRLIEAEAHRAAEDACNGDITDTAYEALTARLSNRVAVLFGGALPRGFFINGDPRGYALKLDDEKYKDVPYDDKPIHYTDMGGYMILAPDRYK